MPDVPANSVHPATRLAWRKWLASHHDSSAGVWVITWKKSANKPTLSYGDIVEECLCFGWVDSKPGKLDEQRTMLYCSPRKPRSGWSRPNKVRIERLIAHGLMHAAGLAKIEAAKEDGTWTKLDAVEDLTIPSDLASSFGRHPGSRGNFEAFPRSTRRGILELIVNAKRPETRARRVEETATLAAKNMRANQWKPRAS